jgi:hypothetical protein
MRNSGMLGAVVALGFAASAFAQPASTNLGSLAVPGTLSSSADITGGTIVWYQVTLSAAINATNWLDIYTDDVGEDTELGFFDSTGALVGNDDDGGVFFASALSFGAGSGLLRGDAGDGPSSGQDGASVAAGVYYLAVCEYNGLFSAPWIVTTDGTGGAPVPVSLATGTAPPPPITWNETTNGGGDAADLPASAQAVTITGTVERITGRLVPSDVDMYCIQICDFANFRAASGGSLDSQMWLFNSSGLGVSFSDDTATGTLGVLTSQFVTANGQYYLAISQYDRDAVDSAGVALWNDMPFGVERQPDGMGVGAVRGWAGSTGGNVDYSITLTGGCGCSVRCVADTDDGSGTGTPDGGVGIEDLLYYLTLFEAGSIGADVDDGSATGTPDGGVGIEDLLYFLVRFEAGC